jgi:hypothetical protein
MPFSNRSLFETQVIWYDPGFPPDRTNNGAGLIKTSPSLTSTHQAPDLFRASRHSATRIFATCPHGSGYWRVWDNIPAKKL